MNAPIWVLGAGAIGLLGYRVVFAVCAVGTVVVALLYRKLGAP